MRTYTPGLLGKLPSTGDFVRRGWSPELCDCLDKLLESALQSAYAEGSTRESLERTAPGFALHLKPGVIAPTGLVACVLPSWDRVGRFFPLCAGVETSAPEPGDRTPAPLFWPSLGFASCLRDLMLAAQNEGQSADELMSALPSGTECNRLLMVDPPFTSEIALGLTIPSLPVSATQLAFEGPEPRMSPLDTASCSGFPLQGQFLALGATLGDGEARFDSFFATRSLLTWSSLAALFDGRWEHWEWKLARRVPRDAEDQPTTLPPPEEEAGSPVIHRPED